MGIRFEAKIYFYPLAIKASQLFYYFGKIVFAIVNLLLKKIEH